MQGIEITDKQFSGGSFDWLTPFSILCGFGLISGYALLGAGWLMMKTEGELAARARRQAEAALLTTLFFIAAVSIWTPLASDRIQARWFRGNHLLYLWPVPFATAAVAMICWARIRKGSGLQTFLSTMTFFLLCVLGLVRPAGNPDPFAASAYRIPADKAYYQPIESSTAYRRQVRVAALAANGVRTCLRLY